MRLYPILRTRRPQSERQVPFQAILPLSLKDRVSGKGDKTSEVACLQEMATLFVCLKDHDFSEKFCSKEIQEFKSCYNMSLEKKKARKALEEKGSVGVTAATASSLAINRVLRRFPTKDDCLAFIEPSEVTIEVKYHSVSQRHIHKAQVEDEF